ncbi:MAG: Ig-like domain-containing protein [Fuerstiella sp.]
MANGALQVALDLDVLVFSEDADNDLLAVRLVTGVSHGTLNLKADGTFEYTSVPGFVGEDLFRYEVTDGVHIEERTALISVRAPDGELLANRLQDIGLALYNHHDVYQRFPKDPADTSKRDQYDANGAPMIMRQRVLKRLCWSR